MPILERFSSSSIRKSRERAKEEIQQKIKAAKENADNENQQAALVSLAVATDFISAARQYLLITDKERDKYRKQLNEISQKVLGREQTDEIIKRERSEKDRRQKELYRSMETWKEVINKERERRGKAEPEDRTMEDPNRQSNAESNEEVLEHNHGSA